MVAKVMSVRHKAVWGSGTAVAMLVSCVLFAGCGKAREGRAAASLVIESLTGASGAEPEEYETELASDVLTIVKSGTEEVPTIFQDPGQVTLRLVMKDVAGGTAPTSNNWVTLTRYHVSYFRADGRNTPGVDVPYGFDGTITGTVTGSASFGFTLVRAAAKAEAPLPALVGGGGARFISAIAEVTFYGQDGHGNDVSATGRISVHFADWGDPG